MTKILLVEDDESIRLGLRYYLEQESYQVLENSTVKEAIRTVEDDPEIDLILLDLNLPDGNGFDLFRTIKEKHDIPVIFLTANDLEVSIVMGLDMGADDYITKPFKARELISRMKAVLRRTKGKQNSNVIQIRDLVIDLEQAKVLKNGVDVMLTALEYKILLILALNPNTVFTREKILADIWDVNEAYVNDNTLTVYIKRIREKIEDDPMHPKIILTVRGVGYKVGDVC
ncbi:MAG TPA: response regulator transcription factor [Candidatus Fimihabitans intestinipullorum]|uniref:Response regulator transcription factor n=1 Tax=Candidatus Fimihabitans intestinipullorum TaxID=2840820 RepID=A0A9D1HVW9_9BACT|nr:response regulator transcription factor [Candidatus Fimihabitans intestinipullorum]